MAASSDLIVSSPLFTSGLIVHPRTKCVGGSLWIWRPSHVHDADGPGQVIGHDRGWERGNVGLFDPALALPVHDAS